MLILTLDWRNAMIGDEVTVTVLGVKGNQVRLVSMHLKKSLSIVKKFTNEYSEKDALKHV